MESLVAAWRFLLLISVFTFPQLLGILLYFRLSRAPRWLAAFAGIIAPAILFVFLAPIFFFGGLREAQPNRATCGMPALAAMMLVFIGSIIQLVLGIFSQLILRAARR